MALIYQPSKRIFCGWFEPLKSTTYSEYPVFQTYRKGVEEITDVNLRQNVSDALIKYASLMDVNELTANGKSKLLEHVTDELRHQLGGRRYSHY